MIYLSATQIDVLLLVASIILVGFVIDALL
jgi:hypothetical protein